MKHPHNPYNPYKIREDIGMTMSHWADRHSGRANKPG